mgnify:CR=1 FL=1
MFDDYILRKQIWEEYQDDLVELQEQVALETLNKLYNRKGYTLADYKNYGLEN